MSELHHTFCRICESLCGLEVTVEDGRVTQLRPDPAHVATDGFSCIKGLKQHKIYDSPDRLLYPQKRTGGSWQRLGWDTALSEIGAALGRIRRTHGPDAIAMYVGTAAGFGVLHPIFAQGLMTGIGSKSMYSSATQDCANKFAVARELYGFPFTQPFPDLDHVECLIVVGANPAVSKWSFLQVPNPVKQLRALTARGACLYIVDPRRTESAQAAGEHVFIRPGTDCFFYAAFLNELIAQGGVDPQRVHQYTTGFDALTTVVAPWTPERTAEVTRIQPAKLREMVTAYRTARGAALYSSTGVNMGGGGTVAFWLQEAINLVSGNLDRRGGTLVGRGIIDLAAFGKKTGALLRRDRSRIGDFPSVNDTFPGGLLADEILTPGPGQLRALIVTGGNPLLTMANSARLRDAFAQLELLVVLDILPSETAAQAHYVLPCTSPLERPDLPFVFPLLLGLQRHPYLQATLPVVAPPGEVRDEATIYLDLARAARLPLFGSKVVQTVLELARSVHTALRPTSNGQPSVPQTLLLALLLRATGQTGPLSWRGLLRAPHGVLRPPHRPDDFLSKRVVTDDGRVHLATPALRARAAQLEADFAREQAHAHRLKLITRRAVTSHNSWTHNVEEFVAGDRGTNYLYMHPDDARRSAVAEGDYADVRSATATVRLPVKYCADLMPGTVALPHGWGHQHAHGLSVARRTRGVNVNLLAADGPDAIDRVSGMAQLTGIVVDVAPAGGPAQASWSGR